MIHAIARWYTQYILIPRLHAAARDPAETQKRVLKNILTQNKHTEFGQQHQFENINSIDEYRSRVPIQQYENLRPYIERQIRSNIPGATTDSVVLYAQTSGTTGAPKYIPIIKRTLHNYRRAQAIFANVQERDVPGIFSGKILAIVSPAIEGHFPPAAANQKRIPYGSMSGLVYKTMPRIIRRRYVLPPETFEIKDYEAKYLAIAALALCCDNITVIASANPSTFLRLLEIINANHEALLEFIEQGNPNSLGSKIDLETSKWIRKHVSPSPGRAQHLKRVFSQNGQFTIGDLWSSLKAVVTWTGGNCALLLPALQKNLSPSTRLIEMGYLASELRGTITIDCHHNLGLPTLQDHFFEFIEPQRWELGESNTLMLNQIEIGKTYYIIATTPNGLYRYFMNDLVTVTAKYMNTPTIAFQQKGKGVTNITGEKLYESQVIQAVQLLCASFGIESTFFIMLASKQLSKYTLYIETQTKLDLAAFTESLHETMSLINTEYRDKTASGRLANANVKILEPSTREAYKTFSINAGQREGQFKMIHLQYYDDVTFPIESYVVP